MKKQESGFLWSNWFMSRPRLVGFVIFMILCSSSLYITLLTYRNHIKIKERDMQSIMQVIENNINKSLNNNKLAALTLALTINDKAEPENFDSVAAYVVNAYSSVDAVQLVPNGVIKYVYPLRGNEDVINYNILLDSTRNKEAFKAISQRRMFFAGPFKLKQGGNGIVGRLPIFIRNKFWGFSAVIIKLETLFAGAGIDNSGKSGYYFQFSKINPDTRQVDYFLPLRKDISMDDGRYIYFPDGEWKLHVIPAVDQKSNRGIIALAGFGILFSIFSALFVAGLLKKPAALQVIVDTQSATLVKNAQRNDAILEALPDMLFIFNEEGVFIDYHNAREHEMLLPPEFFLGKKVTEVMPPAVAAETLENLKRVIQTGNLLLHNYSMEAAEGERHFEGRYALSSKSEVLVVVRETTKEKKSEKEILQMNKELRILSDHLQTVREDERSSLSRELHDELGQQLTAITLDLYWLKKSIPVTKEKILSKINDAIGVVHQSSATVRRINTELRPSILDDLGLFAAIEWQLDDFSSRNEIKNHLELDCEEPRFNASKSIAVFRIIQESLNNIAKHAGAGNVQVRLFEAEGELNISIKDDGKGFDAEISRKKLSFGLIGMKERVNLLKGHLDINSEPGKGTQILVRIPLEIQDEVKA